ncbi:MAG: hypothetical protein NTX45_09420 [Proteobacteria bacterium]|nr:hypothetical protein [Pseudomonadota bacterium]
MNRFLILLLIVFFFTDQKSLFAEQNQQPSSSTRVLENSFDSVSPSEYKLDGNTLRLSSVGGSCVIEYNLNSPQRARKILDLHPPCYLLTWDKQTLPITRKSAISGGVAIGNIGEPMVWQYPSAKNVKVLIVLGDIFSPELLSSNLYQLRKRQNLHCAPSAQGVLINKHDLQLSKVRSHVGLMCAELGVEEASFWLFAHPTK